jgi:hypothetical protein
MEVPGTRSLPAIGLEAEFNTIVDGVSQKPEDVFKSPRKIVRGPLVHRTGKSYHLPTGGAIYFDTGVVEVATPMIEIAQGCAARATRSLWESIGFLRTELDAWETNAERTVRLAGFSTHYNVSFDGSHSSDAHHGVHALAYLLTHIVAAPVMLLAANRRSTGVGVRPRGNRIEITADFTPDAALMAATATLIVGIVREVMRWPTYALSELHDHGIPQFSEFVPIPHSSRKGWVAKFSCFHLNPFTADIDAAEWRLTDGSHSSLRDIAGRTVREFWHSIEGIGDPLSLRLIAGVMRGRAPSLLELEDRPPAYDDVGRLCRWNDLFPVTLLSRSRYERVLRNTIERKRVRVDGQWHTPIGVRGWTHVVLRRDRDGAKLVRSLDDLLEHLDAWERSSNRRVRERRAEPLRPIVAERRVEERRVAQKAHTEDSLPPTDEREISIPVSSERDRFSADSSRSARASTEPPLVIVTRF